MSEQPHEHEHEGPSFQLYMMVFFILCVGTAVSFIASAIWGHNHTTAAVILAVAVVKATCVALIFMHLKYDWGKVYCIVIPVCILTVMMVVILSIDQTLAWHAYPLSLVPFFGGE